LPCHWQMLVYMKVILLHFVHHAYGRTQYRIEEGCHHLEADIGFPEQPSAKFFFARKPHITVIVLLYLYLCVFGGICANCAVVGFHDVNLLKAV